MKILHNVSILSTYCKELHYFASITILLQYCNQYFCLFETYYNTFSIFVYLQEITILFPSFAVLSPFILRLIVKVLHSVVIISTYCKELHHFASIAILLQYCNQYFYINVVLLQ